MLLSDRSQGKITLEEARKKIHLVDSQVPLVYICPGILNGSVDH